MKAGAPETSGNIVIQDIVCVGISPEADKAPFGEFQGCVSVEYVDDSNRVDRLLSYISDLTNLAARTHLDQNCDANNNLKPECKNNIVRLVTNEFMFYTKTPLSLKEFSSLQQQIANMAASQPENLHLVLASFAVRTSDKPNSPVMNVVAHVECGQEPKLNFIVKNYPSESDPVYTEEAKDGRIYTHKNVENSASPEQIGTKEAKEKEKLNERVEINGKKCPFSFNNVLVSKTAGNESFFSCVDICYDHKQAVAKQRLTQQLTTAVEKAQAGKATEALPTLCSHVVVSNCITIMPSKKLSEIVTHADPKYSPDQCKLNTEKTHSQIKEPAFGTPVRVITTTPLACSPLLQEEHRAQVQAHNERVVAPTPPSAFLSVLSEGRKRASSLFTRSPVADERPKAKESTNETRVRSASNAQVPSQDNLLERLSSVQNTLERHAVENPSLGGALDTVNATASATVLLRQATTSEQAPKNDSTDLKNDTSSKRDSFRH